MSLSEYHFTDKEWSALPYNVRGLGYTKSIGILDRFKELNNIKEFLVPLPGLDKDIVLAYIIMNYSPTTPLLKIADVVERKKAAALESGMIVGDISKRLDPEYEEILFCKNHKVNNMIVAYLKTFRNIKWALLCTAIESFYAKVKMILNFSNDSETKTDEEIEKIRGELYKQAETLEASVSRLTFDFLTDDNPYLKEDLFSFVEKEDTVLMLSPELRHAAREAGI